MYFCSPPPLSENQDPPGDFEGQSQPPTLLAAVIEVDGDSDDVNLLERMQTMTMTTRVMEVEVPMRWSWEKCANEVNYPSGTPNCGDGLPNPAEADVWYRSHMRKLSSRLPIMTLIHHTLLFLS